MLLDRTFVRVHRPPDRAVLGAISIVALVYPIATLIVAGPRVLRATDYDLYMDAARRWLSGGPFYQPWQSAGPYDVMRGAILYPPDALPLFAVFTALPAFLWWAIPIGLIAYAVRRLRPEPVVWPFLALCLAWPTTLLMVVHGNPVMWAAAAVAMGALYGWPSVFVLVKPSLFPFALLGGRRRSWWLVLAVAALVALPFGRMWLDWLTAIRYSGGGLLYSINELPLMLLPLVAYLGRTAQRQRA